MKKRTLILISTTIILTLMLSACAFPIPAQPNMVENPIIIEKSGSQAEIQQPSPTQPLPLVPAPEDTPEVTETAVNTGENDDSNANGVSGVPSTPRTVGPDNFPEGINPLTGLPAKNPDLLKLPPALISISNFPASGRPQAGLNSSPIIFELAIGEGMTRFLAMFYGSFPELISGQTEGQIPGSQSVGGSPAVGSSDGGTSDGQASGDSNNQTSFAAGAGIGPIRSGRLPYEDIRSTYSGFLIMASAYSGVAQTLSQTTSIFGSDSEDINSAMINVNQLQSIAQSRAEGYPGSNFSLEGMMFSDAPPNGGQRADQAWVFYSNLNQIQWRYDQDLGAYVRYDIKTDSSGEFVMATDRLTGEPVSRENVIVIFAEHDYKAPTLIDIDLINKPPMKALLFRDGEVHEIFWTTRFGDYEQDTGLLRPIRFVDVEGNPVAMKPGQTWIHLVSTASYYIESAISEAPFHPIIQETGTGLWLVRYKGKY